MSLNQEKNAGDRVSAIWRLTIQTTKGSSSNLCYAQVHFLIIIGNLAGSQPKLKYYKPVNCFIMVPMSFLQAYIKPGSNLDIRNRLSLKSYTFVSILKVHLKVIFPLKKRNIKSSFILSMISVDDKVMHYRYIYMDFAVN